MSEVTEAERIEIAEWCGWKWMHSGSGVHKGAKLLSPSDVHYARFDLRFDEHAEPGAYRSIGDLPKYGTSLDACREFERLAEERGLWAEYSHELDVRIKEKLEPEMKANDERWEAWSHFCFATADETARCRAILAVVRAGKEGK